MKHLTISGSAASFIGERTGNQDNLRFGSVSSFVDQKETYRDKKSFSTETPQLFCVCDGVGGEAKGDLASRAALMGVEEYLASVEYEDDLADYVLHAAEHAQMKVCEMYDELGLYGGTTLVMIGILGDEFVSLNIGDSPIFWYHRKTGKLEELSERHNMAWESIRRGEEPRPGSASQLLKCLGLNYSDFAGAVFMRSGTLKPGDAVLLCSDGVSEAFTEEKLIHSLKWRRKASFLCSKAEKVENADNCTAICLHIKRGR